MRLGELVTDGVVTGTVVESDVTERAYRIKVHIATQPPVYHYVNEDLIERGGKAWVILVKPKIGITSFTDDFPSGYLCVCGEAFKEPEERILHGAYCKVWRDHKLGREILKSFPQNKYGGYVIVAPAILVAFIRDAIKKEKS
jgi:hypothetical protein